MNRLLFAPLLVASALLALGAASACDNDGDSVGEDGTTPAPAVTPEVSPQESDENGTEDGAGSPQDYLGQVTPPLERTLDVNDEWNQLQEEIFQIDATLPSLSEAEGLVEEQLAAARNAKTPYSDALTVMQSITAPDECLEAHVAIIESMQLSERGFGDIVSSLTLSLRGGSGAEALERGNRLLAEADRVKARSLPELDSCFS